MIRRIGALPLLLTFAYRSSPLRGLDRMTTTRYAGWMFPRPARNEAGSELTIHA